MPVNPIEQKEMHKSGSVKRFYTTDGILRINLPPESGVLLRWKPDVKK
jgi:hypothetical protein